MRVLQQDLGKLFWEYRRIESLKQYFLGLIGSRLFSSIMRVAGERIRPHNTIRYKSGGGRAETPPKPLLRLNTSLSQYTLIRALIRAHILGEKCVIFCCLWLLFRLSGALFLDVILRAIKLVRFCYTKPNQVMDDGATREKIRLALLLVRGRSKVSQRLSASVV